MTVYDPSYRCLCGHWNKQHGVKGFDLDLVIDGMIDMAAYERSPQRWGSCTLCGCEDFHRAIAESRAYRHGH